MNEPRSGVGSGSGIMLRAPDHVDQLLGDDHAAHGDEDLLQVLAVDRPDHHALEEPAERARRDHGRQHRQARARRGSATG